MPEKQIKIESEPMPGKTGGKLDAWVTAIASAGVLLLTAHFIYSFGVFVKPLTDTFGWSRASISLIASIRNAVTAIFSPIAGVLSDRYGSRKLILLGVFLCGLGYLLASRATSLWQFYLFFGVLVGICNGITFSPIVATITRWFGRKAALATGVATSGISIAQIVLPPVVTLLVAWHGWETSLIILGGASWLLGTLSWSFIKNPPATIPSPEPEAARSGHTVGHDYTLAEAMRTPAFWFIFFVFFLQASNFQMIVVHIVIDAVGVGAAAAAAAFILTIIGITNTMGRLTISRLADRIGGRGVLALCMILQAVLLIVLGSANNLPTFYIAGAVYGALYGSVQPVVPTLTGNYFGTRNMGAIYGMLNFGYLSGAAIGPLLAGYVFDITDSYYTAFIIGATLSIVAFALCLLLRRPERKVAPQG